MRTSYPRFEDDEGIQFEYYGTSKDRFIKLLNRVPQDDVRYPITIAHENDPDGRLYWSYARGLVGES